MEIKIVSSTIPVDIDFKSEMKAALAAFIGLVGIGLCGVATVVGVGGRLAHWW